MLSTPPLNLLTTCRNCRAAFADETGLEQMIHMLDGMRGINLIQTYGGGPYDLRTYIPHQVEE